MFANLSTGRLYLDIPFAESTDLATEFGFAAVDPPMGELRSLPKAARAETADKLTAQGLRWGPTGVPIGLHDRSQTDAERTAKLTEVAEVLADAGVDRAVTFLLPTSDDHTYRDNFAQFAHVGRLVANIFADHGVRLGLEYVGPKTFWASKAHPFIHTLAETRELIAEIGVPGVGLALDSFHWFTAQESADEIRSLTDADVVAVDLNDGHPGRSADEQLDQERELPGASGVIDLAAFVSAIKAIGYTGPVQLEPFLARLRDADPHTVVTEAAASLQRTLALA